MCRWYCTSVGPATNLECLHCGKRYCSACLHGEGGKMESLVKCSSCGKKPRTLPKGKRDSWQSSASQDVLDKSGVPESSGLRLRPKSKNSLFVGDGPAAATTEIMEDIDEHLMVSKLEHIYDYYCQYAPSSSTLDNVKWFKSVRDLGLIDKKRVSRVDVDLIFTRTKRKGERRMGFDQFVKGMAQLAELKYPPESGVTDPLAALLATDLRHVGTKKQEDEADDDEYVDYSGDESPQHGHQSGRRRLSSSSNDGVGRSGGRGSGRGSARGSARGSSDGRLGRSGSTLVDFNEIQSELENIEVRGKLKSIFDYYCQYSPAATRLDNVKWFKMHKELGLIDKQKCTKVDMDLIFTKVKAKGYRKLAFKEFCQGMADVAKRKYPNHETPLTQLVTHNLAHVEISVSDDTPEPSPKTRKKRSTSDAKRGSRRKSNGPSIFDRLTDTSGYTGTHKHRFDKKGKGRGLAGRDSIAKGGSGGKDLSALVTRK
eukprot:TRINITY_DN66830_c13_g7_i1.p1 TRINITY_DN66830_c13_g7~~TRINITY_DN66830_c13_g7_i1.p1  ORF type:complete len:484 (-),score=251.26 TRINITY_DN66830_c13_g7_i1:82-1533(-)